jgi:putative ABC transport system permease protein
MSQALRQAVRPIILHPGFSAFVVLIIALCIGGNASVFSAARAILYKDLPFADSERLTVLSLFYQGSLYNNVSHVEMADWRRAGKSFEKTAQFCNWNDRLLLEGDTVERIGVNYVEPGYFELLGVRPALGRLFSEQENGGPGSAPVLLLSHDLWKSRYGQDPGILGRTVTLNGEGYTVVGVLPSDFKDRLEDYDIEAWIPAVMAASAFSPDTFESRNARIWFGLGRLADGTTVEQAQQEADAIFARLQREFPEEYRDLVARVTPLRQFVFRDLVQRMEVLLAGAVFVLLIGCANVANLLLVRWAERKRELSLRLALGAGRRRLVQQVVLESLVLAGLGGMCGLLLAVVGTRLLAGMIQLPPFVDIELDGGVLAFAVVATLLTGILFSLPAAIGVARLDSRGTLQQIKDAGGRAHSSRSRNGLLVFQVAVVMSLLVIAGLLLQSFMRLRGTGLGIASDRLLTLALSFHAETFEQDRALISQREQELLDRLQAVPGVEGAAIWGPGMPGIASPYTNVNREGAPAEEASVRVDMHSVNPGALQLLGIPVLRGRDVALQDTREVPRVALVSQSLAEALWPGQDPLGKRLLRTDRANDPVATVVGIIPDVKLHGRFVETGHHLVYSHVQLPTRDTNLLVRTSTGAAAMTDTLRQVVRQVSPQIPVFDVATLADRLAEQEGAHRLNAAVVTAYAVLALLLAVLGLYGLLAYSVVQRTREIGVRMALGAPRDSVLRMVMGKGLALVGIGLVLGLAGAMAITSLLSTQLYGVTARDPLTFVATSLFFALIAAVATYLPARKALRVEPTTALRSE